MSKNELSSLDINQLVKYARFGFDQMVSLQTISSASEIASFKRTHEKLLVKAEARMWELHAQGK